jgi:hypothetical protein
MLETHIIDDDNDDDENNASRSPPIDAFSEGCNGPKDEVSLHKQNRSDVQAKKQSTLSQGGRMSIPTPRKLTNEEVTRALTGRCDTNTSPIIKGRSQKRTIQMSQST